MVLEYIIRGLIGISLGIVCATFGCNKSNYEDFINKVANVLLVETALIGSTALYYLNTYNGWLYLVSSGVSVVLMLALFFYKVERSYNVYNN